MILSVGFCVLFVATCAIVLAETQTQVGNNQDGSKHIISDYDAAIRKKRAFAFVEAARLLRKGIKAVKSLTKGAQEIPSKRLSSNPSDKMARQFVKKGTYDRAVKDFYAVNPVDPRDFTTPVGIYGKAGNVGDRLIFVKSSHEVIGKPTVEIFQSGGLRKGKQRKVRLTDIITYTD